MTTRATFCSWNHSPQSGVRIKVKFNCQWTSYTFLKSGDHQKIKHINFKILAVKKFINFTLNFEILDFENFLFLWKSSTNMSYWCMKSFLEHWQFLTEISWKFDKNPRVTWLAMLLAVSQSEINPGPSNLHSISMSWLWNVFTKMKIFKI